MKKKIFSILVCGITLLSVCGCSENVEKEEENNIIDSYEIKCDALDNVKFSTRNGFVTNDNDAYYVIYGKTKNGNNCIKLNEVPIKTYYNGGFIDFDNNFYRENGQEVLSKQEGYSLSSIENYGEMVKHASSFELYTYILKSDGMLYDENNNVVESFDNEKIEDFGTDMITYDFGLSYVKTDKAYYTVVVTNEAECEEYADIECNYELKQNKYLTDNYDSISYIKEVHLGGDVTFITKDSKVIKMNILK